MTSPKEISIDDYTYQLPDNRIALHPKDERDSSKLLIYNDGKIEEDIYKNIAGHLPQNSLLVFNDTKVIKARIRFQKATGSSIEVFCLEPYEAINEYSSVMSKKESVRWKCMIGGASKWKEDELVKQLMIGSAQLVDSSSQATLTARLLEKLSDAYVVEFSWRPSVLSFAEVIAAAGDIPLPPYIKRSTGDEDTERYQTVYAAHEGSVAAPTAGLHFTQNIFNDLLERHISKAFVTLHVGAGTFKPVKADSMLEHEMHAEWINVDIDTIKNICSSLPNTIIAVGTTSLRTLESLYWMGVKVALVPQIRTIHIGQWEVYEPPLVNAGIPVQEALHALIKWMMQNGLNRLFSQTQILIAPGYTFRIVKAIITNFHQPRSTLLLLVAAAIGPNWQKVYDHALQNGLRFLSYGDGSLLFIKEPATG